MTDIVTDIVLVLTTASTAALGEAVARALVDERLAACVNVLAPMTSLYRWRGVVMSDTECQLVIKTTRDRVGAIDVRLKQLHAYELPELLVIGVEGGADAYLAWVSEATRPPT